MADVRARRTRRSHLTRLQLRTSWRRPDRSAVRGMAVTLFTKVSGWGGRAIQADCEGRNNPIFRSRDCGRPSATCIDPSGVAVERRSVCTKGGGACIRRSGPCADPSAVAVGLCGVCLHGRHVCIDPSVTCIDRSVTCIERSTACIDRSSACIDRSTACIERSSPCADGSSHCADGSSHCADGSSHCANRSSRCADPVAVRVPVYRLLRSRCAGRVDDRPQRVARPADRCEPALLTGIPDAPPARLAEPERAGG